MQLLLDEKQEALRAQARALGQGLPPDGEPGLAEAALNGARAAGTALLTVPADRGGAGLSILDACLYLEGLARSRPSAASTLGAHALLVGASLASGRGGEDSLDALAADRTGAFALTEPGGGRRFNELETVARPDDDDGYRVTGEKLYVTNGGAQALVLVVARLDGGEDLALFVVDGDGPGAEWRHRRGSVGLLGARIADLALHEAPALARVRGVGGPDGGGGADAGALVKAALLTDRTAIAAQATGVASEALEETLRHVSARELFGRPMAGNGTVQAQVADMAAALDGACLLWRQAACALDAGNNAEDLTAMAKLHAARAARQVTDGCLQLMGGAGCFDGAVAARRVGDARLASIRGGPDELMRAIAAARFLARLDTAGMIT